VILGESGPESSQAMPRRRGIFIVGSGRSGTSALACTLQSLGLHVPQPEVPADESNPKGFGESQWVVDFHDRILRRANVRVADARPQAWFDTARISALDRPREEAYAWLAGQFDDGVSEIVLKDPRLAWFIGLWRSAALRLDVESSYVIMLRTPAEVVGSKQKYYSAHSSSVSAVSRAASWINQMLHTERATREERRAFVHYSSLLDDWTIPIYRLGQRFGLEGVNSASARDLRRIHDLIDPELHRVRTTWEDVHLPKSLRLLIDETWHQLDNLARHDDESTEQHTALDQIRHEYVQLYEEAEAISESSAVAARRKRKPDRASDTPEAPPAIPESRSAPLRTPGILGRLRG
jgi:hypothetical protein